MSSQIVLIFGIVAGFLGLCLGVFITYERFKKTRSHLKSLVRNAEKELEQDLMDVTEAELSKTQAGRELSFIISQEKMRSFAKLDPLDNLIIEGAVQRTKFIVALKTIFIYFVVGLLRVTSSVISFIAFFPIKLIRFFSLKKPDDLNSSSVKEAKK